MKLRFLATLFAFSSAQPIGNACDASNPSQQWAYDSATGALKSGRGTCLASQRTPPADGTTMESSPCDGSASQAFDILTDGNLIVARARPQACINLAGYGTAPGTQVWLYGCTGAGYTCNGNCDWEWGPGGVLRNKESGLCLDDAFAPPMLPTCAKGAPSAGLPFCDASLPNAVRAADLTARLSTELKLALFALPLPSVPFSKLTNLTLGLAAFFWDVTMIHGLSTTFFLQPLRNATCFPHSIGQAASWDVDLVGRIASAVAYEARVMNELNFQASNGRAVQALMAEGGPLANSVHDPRCAFTPSAASFSPPNRATLLHAPPLPFPPPPNALFLHFFRGARAGDLRSWPARPTQSRARASAPLHLTISLHATLLRGKRAQQNPARAHPPPSTSQYPCTPPSPTG
jgi:hypothetical protein